MILGRILPSKQLSSHKSQNSVFNIHQTAHSSPQLVTTSTCVRKKNPYCSDGGDVMATVMVLVMVMVIAMGDYGEGDYRDGSNGDGDGDGVAMVKDWP